MVSRIMKQNVEIFSYQAPMSPLLTRGKSTLTVIQPGLLLWQHSYGSMLINIDARIAKSVHLRASSDF